MRESCKKDLSAGESIRKTRRISVMRSASGNETFGVICRTLYGDFIQFSTKQIVVMSTLFRSLSMSSSAGDSNLFTGNSALKNDSVVAGKPEWAQNSRRRVIPSHLAPKKKTGFHLSSSVSTRKSGGDKKDVFQAENGGEFNLLSFGTNQKRLGTGSFDRVNANSSFFDTSFAGDLTRFDDAVNSSKTQDDFLVYTNDEDMPPSRSIYDLNDEVLISLKSLQNNNEDKTSDANDPKNFRNIFVRDAPKASPSEDPNDQAKQLSNGELAILVFGYPETMANQVIAYFQEFGTILEDFEVLRKPQAMTVGLQDKQFVPIFSGNSWTKITYDNPASAVDALLENGAVFNGVLLGVIPYTKDAVERLQKRKLTSSEDIGSGITTAAAETKHKDQGTIENDIPSQYMAKLDIKDGSNLFISTNTTSGTKVDPKKEQKKGVVGTVLRYFFGFNEL